MSLTNIIITKINKQGPISFRDFMEMALYYPCCGYYTSEKKKIGKQGDFYTSPVLSSFYGQMIGRQLEDMWSIMEKKPFHVVEYGAGTGALCFDILHYLEKNPDLYHHLKYYIIEKSASLKKEEQTLLHEKVEWIKNISEIEDIAGCILSNEVVDNFSVHAVVMKKELMEVFVDYQNEFVEILRPASEELKNYFKSQKIVLPENYRTEVNLEALKWIKEVANNLEKGYVISIDYGFPANELYSEKRNRGTLACYYNHSVTDEFYSHIGFQDITAHVNFSALKLWGNKYGLEYSGFCNQNYFLRSLGLADYLRKLEMKCTFNEDEFFRLNKMLMEMGSKFKVLIQQKGISMKSLRGLQFSQPLS